MARYSDHLTYEAPSFVLVTLVLEANAAVSCSQSAHENRIYSVNIHCGDSYPDSPPTIQFVSKVNLPCVDQRNGKVGRQARSGLHAADSVKIDPSKVPCLASWKRDYNMETILIELRRYTNHPFTPTAVDPCCLRYMALPQHKKLQQPKEGETF